jgi:hypothetical protein
MIIEHPLKVQNESIQTIAEHREPTIIYKPSPRYNPSPSALKFTHFAKASPSAGIINSAF